MKEEKTEQKKPRGRRRSKILLPKTPAIPVRALWESASPEQQTRAHETGVAIVEYWTGRITKEEVAHRLQIPPLRVWQLAQQATSGMLAGLLIQPKTRVKGVIMDPSEDPKQLKKKIADLEATIRRQNLLIQVLRSMPGCRQVPLPADPEATTHTPSIKETPTDATTATTPKRKRGRPRKAE